MEKLEQRLDRVLAAIESAAQKAGRKGEDIALVAVSKLHPVEQMNLAAAALRARGRNVIFGENYLQEYAQKHSGLTGAYETHLIGPLQSNKVAKAVREFDLIQSVHSEKVLTLIDRAARDAGKIMPVFLQVNISADPGKSGFSAEWTEDGLENLIAGCSHIRVAGLMTITELYPDPELARSDYSRMRQIRDRINQKSANSEKIASPLALSMGMSADFEIAIAEGATHVRVGTAIFGERAIPAES